MFCRCSHASPKITQIISNIFKSSNLIKPPRQKPRNSSKDTSSLTKFHPPCAWRSYKCKSFKYLPQRSCGAARSDETGAVDTEAAAVAAPLGVAAEDIHSIGHVAPCRCVHFAGCGRRSAGGQLTPAIGLAKVAKMF